MKDKRRLILLLALLLGLGAYGVYRLYLSRQPIEWSGTVEARTIDVGSRVGGRIERVMVREGDHVSANQPLIILEVGELAALKMQAEGQLEQAQANLAKLSMQLPSARRDEIAAAQARVRAQQAAVTKASEDRQRIERLFSGAAVPKADVEAATASLANATAQRAALTADLNQLLSGTPQDVKAARGSVDAAQGRLDQIEVQLAELTIISPRAARVESLDLRPGDILAPNVAAARLIEDDQLYVRLYIPETQLGYVKPGQIVPLSIDTFPRQSFKGVVESIAHEGEFTPRNLQTADERANQVFATRVRIDEGKDVLRAGMTATVRVHR